MNYKLSQSLMCCRLSNQYLSGPLPVLALQAVLLFTSFQKNTTNLKSIAVFNINDHRVQGKILRNEIVSMCHLLLRHGKKDQMSQYHVPKTKSKYFKYLNILKYSFKYFLTMPCCSPFCDRRNTV